MNIGLLYAVRDLFHARSRCVGSANRERGRIEFPIVSSRHLTGNDPHRQHGRMMLGPLFTSFAIFTILAAFAVSAVPDYLARSRISDGIQLATTTAAHGSNPLLPTKDVEAISIAADGAPLIRYTARVAPAGRNLLHLVPSESGSWRCGGKTTVPLHLLSDECRADVTALGAQTGGSRWREIIDRALVAWFWVIGFCVLTVSVLVLALQGAMLMPDMRRHGLAETIARLSSMARAIERNNETYVERRLEHAASGELEKRADTWLRLAVLGYRPKVVSLLLRAGAPVSQANARGCTPLHLAEDRRIVELLIRHGADCNARDADGRTPLHYAADYHMDTTLVAEILLMHKASVTAADNGGLTPLHLAMARGHTRISALLRRHGAVDPPAAPS